MLFDGKVQEHAADVCNVPERQTGLQITQSLLDPLCRIRADGGWPYCFVLARQRGLEWAATILEETKTWCRVWFPSSVDDPCHGRLDMVSSSSYLHVRGGVVLPPVLGTSRNLTYMTRKKGDLRLTCTCWHDLSFYFFRRTSVNMNVDGTCI